ncbi:MAG TPA: hypothetical protein VIT45_04640 [Allosphingosinicella sp.]
MNDDESHVDPKAMADTDHFGEALLYDFAKFVTTLALLALGGVLTLTQTADDKIVKKGLIAFVLVCVALAGAFAVNAANSIVDGKTGPKKGRGNPRLQVKIATAFLGLGAGGFLMMSWKSLG